MTTPRTFAVWAEITRNSLEVDPALVAWCQTLHATFSCVRWWRPSVSRHWLRGAQYCHCCSLTVSLSGLYRRSDMFRVVQGLICRVSERRDRRCFVLEQVRSQFFVLVQRQTVSFWKLAQTPVSFVFSSST